MIGGILCLFLIVLGIYVMTIVMMDAKKIKYEENNITDNANANDNVNVVQSPTRLNKQNSFLLIILGIISIGFIVSGEIANLFIPIFNKVYFGNLNRMFINIVKMIIWGFEIFLMMYFCQLLFSIKIFEKKHIHSQKLPLYRLFIIFILAIIPILFISYKLDWNIKIVADLGEKIEKVKVSGVFVEYVANLFKFTLIIFMIEFFQKAIELVVKTKFQIPWGGIIAMLTYGVIEFFMIGGQFKFLYLFLYLIYGSIYLLSNRKFTTTFFVSYLIYLL